MTPIHELLAEMCERQSNAGELKACPFCDTAAEFITGQTGQHTVGCNDADCIMFAGSDSVYDPKTLAERRWNTRPENSDMTKLMKAVERMAEGLCEIKAFCARPSSDVTGGAVQKNAIVQLASEHALAEATAILEGKQ